MKDGLHPVAAGFEVLLSCLADQAAALLPAEQAARGGAGSGTAAPAPAPVPASYANFTDF